MGKDRKASFAAGGLTAPAKGAKKKAAKRISRPFRRLDRADRS
jgi:hypothetical protein